jgi:hypothetical protein
MTEQKRLLCTTTGEIFQLARVGYEVFNKKSVISVFKKLRCLNYDPLKSRWVWLFENEAKNLRFGRTYNQLPKEIRPVVIGVFTFRDETHMNLDVRSFERATKAIEFFDRRINRHVAKVISLRVVNQLFEATQEQSQKLIQESADIFFERDDLPRPKGEELIAKIETLKEKYEDIETRRQVAIEWIMQQALESLPKIEEIPTHYYEDGISPLETALHLRQLQLLEQWKGNENVNSLSILHKIMGGFEQDSK